MDYHKKGKGGGLASYISAVSHMLVKLGHKVVLICYDPKKKEWKKENGCNILYWPFGNIHWYWHRLRLPYQVDLPLREIEWGFNIYKAVNEIKKKFSIDIIETSEIGNLFLSKSKIPYIVRLHGEPYVFTKYCQKPLHAGLRISNKMHLYAMRRAAALTSPSLKHAKEIASQLKWDFKKIKVIPNLAISSFVEAGSSNAPEFENIDAPRIIHPARIDFRKGTIPFLESIPDIIEHFPKAKFVITGDSTGTIKDNQIKEILTKNNIGHCVQITGHVEHEQMLKIYSQSQIVVMPSYYETFGISCLEAMAFGLPVIASNAGGLSEVVENEVTGILIKPGDSRAISEAVLRLLKQPKTCRRMGIAGRKKLLDNFTAEKIAQRTIGFYKEVLGSLNSL